MQTNKRAAVLLAIGFIAVPAAARAMSGPGGCSSLPEYYRALGTLQGGMENACNMTMAQARAIVQGYQGGPQASVNATPAPHARRHDRRAPTQ